MRLMFLRPWRRRSRSETVPDQLSRDEQMRELGSDEATLEAEGLSLRAGPGDQDHHACD